MTGRIASGDTVTLAPCESATLAVGDIVLVQIQGRRYSHTVLHLVKAIENGQFLIGANNGRIDGWVSSEHILGRALNIRLYSNEEV
ncbi:MAG: hypothetical protein JWQ02_713 [Capsulimonas sp.]|nr:hypothetical protein [Capsulimonas sp.]